MFGVQVLEAHIQELNDPKHGKKDKRTQHLQESYKTIQKSLKRVEWSLGYQVGLHNLTAFTTCLAGMF